MQKHNTLLIVIFTLVSLHWFITPPSTAWRDKHYKHKREQIRKAFTKLSSSRKTSEENVFQPRIVGGKPVAWGEAPYYLRMEYTSEAALKPFVCGAALLNHRGLRFVITAAHCLWWGNAYNYSELRTDTVPAEYVYFVGADIDKDVYNPREQRFHAEAILMHSDFDPRTLENDIALLFLKEYAYESLGLERVPGPKEGWSDPQYSTVVGHGAKLRFDNQRFLQKVELETFPRDVCNQGLLQLWNITLKDSQYCMIHPKLWVNQGICYGDSGGPIVAYNYDLQRWYLAGVVSFSSVLSCGTPGVFSISTKLSYYVPWIKKYTNLYIDMYGTGDKYVNGTPDDSDLSDFF